MSYKIFYKHKFSLHKKHSSRFLYEKKEKNEKQRESEE